jgi:hypothetical protein
MVDSYYHNPVVRMVSFIQHSTEPILNPRMRRKQAYNQIGKHRSKIPAGNLAPTRKLPLVGYIGLLFVLLLSISAVHAEFAVIGGNSTVERNRLRTNAELDLTLDRAPAEALIAGIPLNLSVEIRLYRLKGPLWKKQIADWRYRHALDYHRLSGRYSVENVASGQMRTFTTLIEALNSLSLVHISEKLPIPVNNNDRLQVRIRARLEKNELPAPLRLISLFFRDWQQTSKWQQWEITR